MADKSELALNGGPKAVREPIPFVGYGAELIGEAEEANVLDAMRSRILCRLTNTFADSWVNRCEEWILENAGANYVYATNSCASALHAAMIALGIGPGDEVLVSGCGWFSIANAAINAGAVPVPVEYDETLTMDVEDLERKIGPNTRAVVVVHWRGLPANMERILEIAERRGLYVIEDCAQAFGGTYKGRFLGTLGDAGCYSFNMHKIVTCGEGGAIVCRDAEVYRRAVAFGGFYTFYRHYAPDGGADGMPDMPMLNYRLPEMCGAMLAAQLPKTEQVVSTLRARRDEIEAGLREIPNLRFPTRYDREGELGYTIPVAFDTPEKAQFFTQAMQAEGALVSSELHAFAGGEARGTAALAAEQKGDPSSAGQMARAHTWKSLVRHHGPTEKFNPWKWLEGPATPVPDGVIPKTTEAVRRVVTFKTNVAMTPEHAEATVAAARKVAAHL